MTENRENPRTAYADIIDLPHWESPKHPRMSLQDRAAQFAPYAALVGYGDMVKEEARETECFTAPGEDEAQELSRALKEIAGETEKGNRPACVLTYFIPDGRKAGGETVTVKEAVRRIDPVQRKIILAKKTGIACAYEEIGLDRVIRIRREEAGE